MCLAVGAHVAEEEIAEGDGVDVLVSGTATGVGHALFIDFVGAGPGERDVPERKLRGGGLCYEDGAASAVHGDTIEFGVDGGEEADDFDAGLVTEQVEGPGTVFSAAP